MSYVLWIGTIALVGSCILLVISAIWDIRARQIPNKLVGALCVLAFIDMTMTWFLGSSFLSSVIFPLLVAVAVLSVGLILFHFNIMGGGDIKLIAATGLLTGTGYILPFLLWTTIFGGFVSLFILIKHHMVKPRTIPDHGQAVSVPSVPYGVAIAAAGIWVLILKITEMLPELAL